MKPAIPQQLSLFDSPAQRIATLGRAIKLALRAAVEASGLSRAEVVYRANELAAASGVSMCAGNGALSEATFNKWLDLKSPGHMPGVVPMNVLCEVLKDLEVHAVILAVHNREIMTAEDKKFCALGRAYHANEQARVALKKAKEKI
ncbi:hypothetical protein C4J81_10250 [Deltaproteobacteria bacterium Smac51]|nr:hypothetical protein C4J81_10250 [Deltaproteobacteria bacterium Smac51]